jgi:hypothetical protein
MADAALQGRLISSRIAESTVNQVVSMRMAKKQRMRWSDEGAHLLAQVRVHVTCPCFFGPIIPG